MGVNDFPDQIRYSYVPEQGLHPHTAHGVWGGINPHGEIEVCFYDESDALPEYTEQTVGADGIAGPERMPVGDGARHITRHIHSRILLNYNTARAVLEWLEDRIGEMEAEAPNDVYDLGSGIKQ